MPRMMRRFQDCTESMQDFCACMRSRRVFVEHDGGTKGGRMRKAMMQDRKPVHLSTLKACISRLLVTRDAPVTRRMDSYVLTGRGRDFA